MRRGIIKATDGAVSIEFAGLAVLFTLLMLAVVGFTVRFAAQNIAFLAVQEAMYEAFGAVTREDGAHRAYAAADRTLNQYRNITSRRNIHVAPSPELTNGLDIHVAVDTGFFRALAFTRWLPEDVDVARAGITIVFPDERAPIVRGSTAFGE